MILWCREFLPVALRSQSVVHPRCRLRIQEYDQAIDRFLLLHLTDRGSPKWYTTCIHPDLCKPPPVTLSNRLPRKRLQNCKGVVVRKRGSIRRWPAFDSKVNRALLDAYAPLTRGLTGVKRNRAIAVFVNVLAEDAVRSGEAASDVTIAQRNVFIGEVQVEWLVRDGVGVR